MASLNILPLFRVFTRFVHTQRHVVGLVETMTLSPHVAYYSPRLVRTFLVAVVLREAGASFVCGTRRRCAAG